MRAIKFSSLDSSKTYYLKFEVVDNQIQITEWLNQPRKHTIVVIPEDCKQKQKEIAKKFYGKVLVIGMCLGYPQKFLLNNPHVDSITTVEEKGSFFLNFLFESEFLQSPKHRLVLVDNLDTYTTSERYDGIWVSGCLVTRYPRPEVFNEFVEKIKKIEHIEFHENVSHMFHPGSKTATNGGICYSCIWKLAKRLVVNHPSKLDFIEALVLAEKAIRRAAKREDFNPSVDTDPPGCEGSLDCSGCATIQACNACVCCKFALFVGCGRDPSYCTDTEDCTTSSITTESDCNDCACAGCSWVVPPPVGVLPIRSVRSRGGDSRRRLTHQPHLKMKKA